jgi:NADPH-dependent 7-cyano-7-deazaguanine reductase QueF
MFARISHWLPIVTRCPVNGLPDALYVYVTFTDFVELYAARKALFGGLQGRKVFMEDVAKEVFERAKKLGSVVSVRVTLLTGRHEVVVSA